MPSLLFFSLGCFECTLGIARSDKKKVWLGMLILLGGGLVKFEGMIVLFLWIAALMCSSKTRNLLHVGRSECKLLILAAALVLPYGILKIQIPQLHPDQMAFQAVENHPMKVAAQIPKVLPIMLVRQCVDENFAQWTVVGDSIAAWSGKWTGLQSLVNAYNLGWGWVCMFLGVTLMFFRPTRQCAFILSSVSVCFFVVIAIVYCGLPYLNGDLGRIIEVTLKNPAGRHLYPMFLSWGLALIVLAVSDRCEK